MHSNKILVESYKNTALKIENGLVIQTGSGHTKGVSELKVVHPGRNSTIAYAAGRASGKISPTDGLKILNEIKKLQIRDTKSAFYGCFRWYREEENVYDTNAAFFTLEPLVVSLMRISDILSNGEKEAIIDMLKISAEWFLKECQNPILFYTNKIISDGAMLGAIGIFTGNESITEKSRAFYKKWLSYTENRGYGWGENMSLGYNSVILRAFSIILDVVDDEAIIERFKKQEKFILDIFRFHNGHEFVPTIRSYNVSGEPDPWSIAYNLAGVRGFGYLDSIRSPIKGNADSIGRLVVDTMLFKDRVYASDEEYKEKALENTVDVPRISSVRIMDDKKAYSWLGKSGGIGSINEFPVIDGSYQHKGWGLGWQCFPVSYIVYGHGVSFLRFYVDDGKRIRCHPHKNKHDTYLDPALFSETGYPEVRTVCYQSGQSLVAIRSMRGLGNKAAEISDSMDFPVFDGEIIERTVNGRKWFIARYESACIFISPLLGNPVEGFGTGKDDRGRLFKTIAIAARASWENEIFGIRQVLYKGKNKLHYDSRISCGWFIHYHDGFLEEPDIDNWLEDIELSESSMPDGEIPRMPEWNIHKINLEINGKVVLDVSHDPYK
ncbi:MAG: hypothetical protein R3232_06555 [Clostridia bacterium]|nr:hypothetical protein [Clostridia bacterium]